MRVRAQSGTGTGFDGRVVVRHHHGAPFRHRCPWSSSISQSSDMLVRPIFVVPIQISMRSPGVHGPDEVALGAREDQSGKPIVRKIAGQLAPIRPSRFFHVREVDGVVDVAEQIAVAKTGLKR